MNAKQLKELKRKMIAESGLYRAIENTVYQKESEKERQEAQPTTKKLVSDTSQGYENTTTQKNTRESADNYKPKFHL